jgi:hypothetical protein
VAVLAGGCDVGKADLAPAQGPKLRLVAAYPLAGEGLDCELDSGPDCGVPTDAAIELRFDRYLLPSTVVRQSIAVYSGTREHWAFLRPQYDLIERVVRYRLPDSGSWLRGLRYNVELLVATDEEPYGLRAFDGAPLTERGSVPLKFSFRTRTGDPPPADPHEPAGGCEETARVLTKGGCHSAVCHQSVPSDDCEGKAARAGSSGLCVDIPRMGLDLSSTEAIIATAIEEVAHQTETGPSGGVALENPDRFGVQMPVVDPGRPSNSYLIYKLLRDPAVLGNSPCTSRYRVALEGECPDPSAQERERLREWFVLGDAMALGRPGALERRDLEMLLDWIRSGAPTVECD